MFGRNIEIAKQVTLAQIAILVRDEVNPGDKEADEGMPIVNAIRSERGKQAADK
jgi:hypothetical protein